MAGRTMESNGTQASNPPSPPPLYTNTTPIPHPGETAEEKKIRRAKERAGRKKNKREKKNETLICCSQNYNGSSTREKMEESSRQMRNQKIGIIFGQEGRNPTQSMERWDTGEIFIGFGAKVTTGTNRVKEGNFFILDATWREAFVRGGKQMKMYSPRLATITIPLQGGRQLYLLNAHCPDSSKSSAIRKAFQLLLEEALGNKGHDDILVAMGDWNASTGVSEGGDDLVCGPHGIALQDAAGRLLKSTAAMHNMVDLVTWEAQVMSATFYDIGSKKGRQIDRAFVMREHQHMVERCANAAMIVDSDHESVRLKMVIKKAAPAAKTARKNRGQKDVNGTFGPEADSAKKAEAVSSILSKFENNLVQNGSAASAQHTCLMAAVCETIEALDKKETRVSGWCDENEWVLTFAIRARNRASRRYAKDKSAVNHSWYKETRTRVKMVKRRAKNVWLLAMAEGCNLGLLPGGIRNSNPAAIWAFVTKLKRGADKWKGWNVKNVRSVDGELGQSPTDNANNFQRFYNDLYDNDGTVGGKADEWYEQMPQTCNDREWRSPQVHELLRAVRELKNTAPGLTGIPATMWKAIVLDERLQEVMLKIMRDCWDTGTVPSEWLVYYMTVLEKKGDKTLCENYRGISIGETFSKIYATILKHRLADLYERLAPEYCNGFRKGRGRSDSIYVLLEVLRLRKRKGLNSWVTFFDIIKYFDRIPRRFIWLSMEKCGVAQKMIEACKSTLEGAKCMLHIDGEIREVQMNNGSGQGTSLGPTLASYAILPILCFWAERWGGAATVIHSSPRDSTQVYINNFADDTSTINEDRDATTDSGDDFITYLGDFGLKIHVGTEDSPESKTVCIFFPHNETERKKQNTEPIQLTNGAFIPCVDKAVYLGQTITSNLSDATHISVRSSKGAQIFGALGPNLLRCGYVWKDVKRLIFESMIIPTMLDGVECCVLTAGMMDEMTTIYHRLIRSALHVTPFKQRKEKLTSEALLQRIGLHPLHHYVDLKTLAFAGHIQRMGKDRLPKIVRDGYLEGKSTPGRGHKTLAQCITQSLIRKEIEVTEWQSMAVHKEKWRSRIRDIAEGTCARISGKTTRKFIETWVQHPTLLIGRQMLKQFTGGKWHRGLVISTNVDEATNETIWQVRYDDGDKEDFSAREVAASLVNEESEDEDGGAGELSGSASESESASESDDSEAQCNAEGGNTTDGEP